MDEIWAFRCKRQGDMGSARGFWAKRPKAG